MMKNFFLFTLIPFLLFSFKMQARNQTVASEIINQHKYIYIDFSFNSFLLENISQISIHYYDGTHNDLKLLSESDVVFKTESPIPFNCFQISGNGFEIIYNDGEIKSDWLDCSSLIAKPNFNYICISEEMTDSKIKIDGFGVFPIKDKIYDGATYETQRIWFNHNIQNNNDDNHKTKVLNYYYESSWFSTKMIEITNSYDGHRFYYADVPCEIQSVHLLDLSSDSESNYVVLNDFCIESLNGGSCYSLNVGASEVVSDVIKNADISIIASVLESFLTYGASNNNGSTNETVKRIFKTWIENASADEDSFKSTYILDYSKYKDNNNSYDGLYKDTFYSVHEKWTTMCSIAKINPKTGEDQNYIGLLNSKVLVIALSCCVLLFFSIFLTFFFVKKMKANKINDN